jgi:hypothetical protein
MHFDPSMSQAKGGGPAEMLKDGSMKCIIHNLTPYIAET